MLLSMTGYGRVTKKFKDRQIVFELRSLNSKFSDVRLKLPSEYREKEPELRKLISEQVFRGKLDASLEIFGKSSDENYIIDNQAFRSYHKDLKQLSDELDIPSDGLIQAILRLPNVLVNELTEADQQEWLAIKEVVESCVEAFNDFRRTEGASMEKDISWNVRNIASLLEQIEPFEAARKEKIITRLRTNLEEFMGKENVDKNRFEQEVIFYIEKIDIAEEKVRLAQHCTYFMEELTNDSNLKGRKLSFICQEMGREINTLGSKAYYSDIQRVVVEMKDSLEKIKELIANVL